MEYLKSYKLFESLKNEVMDCFLPITDLHLHVKYIESDDTILISILLDNHVESETKKSKWGFDYRPVINGNEICNELADSIRHCLGVGLKIEEAAVQWITAGECSKNVPSVYRKKFKPDGIIGQIESPVPGNYSTDILTNFIEDKKDRLRYVLIKFIK